MSKGVRPIVFEDAKNVASLLSSVSSQQEKDSNTSDDVFRARNWDADDIIRTIQAGGQKFQIFVSTNEANEITGVLICQSYDKEELYINELAVAETYRRKGYGKMLFDYTKQWAKENGCTRIELYVYAFNKNAHDFYKSQGMNEMLCCMEYVLLQNPVYNDGNIIEFISR